MKKGAKKSEGLTRDKKREMALDLYLNTDKSQKEICEIVGWTEKTFSDNKEKGNWEAMKGAETLTAQKIIMKLYKKLDELTEGDLISADALAKTAKVIEMLSNKRTTLSHNINTFKEFTTFLFAKDADLAKKVNKYQQEFINDKVSNG